jgi:transposase
MFADRDHILFDYLESENGPSIYKLFTGFSGYVQADAKGVFNLLFADADKFTLNAPDLEPDGCVRTGMSGALLKFGCGPSRSMLYAAAS